MRHKRSIPGAATQLDQSRINTDGRRRANTDVPPAFRTFTATLLVLVLCASFASAADDAPTTQPSLFRDPDDGAFDVSGFLDTKTGFLPVVMPITEPAVGYGLGVGLTFFHTRPRVMETPDGPRVIPPNLTAVFGMGTASGSWATAAAPLHTWNDGRIRYLIGGGYGSLNLEWFGQSDAFSGRAFSYNLDAAFEFQKLTFKLGQSDFFAGPTQRLMATSSHFDHNDDLPPDGPSLGVLDRELDSTVSGIGVTVGYDTRDSLFSPTRGTKAAVSYTQNADAIGSDFDYGRLDAEVCQYLPLGAPLDRPLTLGLRGAAAYVGDDAPFFDLGSIHLRGIQAGRYVDNASVTTEAELRWDISARWTLIGFTGVGWVAEEFGQLDDADDHWAGGGGFRYLIARKYDLRMGCDVARGPEDWAFYVTVGTGWLRD
jgi:hypothetical protein